eukprot:1187814-Prorocentrum_minimum.AAC.1
MRGRVSTLAVRKLRCTTNHHARACVSTLAVRKLRCTTNRHARACEYASSTKASVHEEPPCEGV